MQTTSSPSLSSLMMPSIRFRLGPRVRCEPEMPAGGLQSVVIPQLVAAQPVLRLSLATLARDARFRVRRGSHLGSSAIPAYGIHETALCRRPASTRCPRCPVFTRSHASSPLRVEQHALNGSIFARIEYSNWDGQPDHGSRDRAVSGGFSHCHHCRLAFPRVEREGHVDHRHDTRFPALIGRRH